MNEARRPAHQVVLVGMPGCGKSTVSRQLARRLHWSAVDSDTEIEKQIGGPIRAFFEREGEAAFRDLEQAMLQRLSQAPRTVLATGGGAVLRAANRAVLRGAGVVVYLRATPMQLFKRLRHDTRRPLLQVADPLARLQALYAERDPLYRETAHFVLDTGRQPIGQLVSRLLMQLEVAGLVPTDAAPAAPMPPPAPPPAATPD